MQASIPFKPIFSNSEALFATPSSTITFSFEIDARTAVWFSKENYIFLKENYGGRVSEIMDAFATFLRTGSVVEVPVFCVSISGGFRVLTFHGFMFTYLEEIWIRILTLCMVLRLKRNRKLLNQGNVRDVGMLMSPRQSIVHNVP